MADQQAGTLEALARELGNLFAPLKDRLQEGQVRLLLAELGLAIPGSTSLPGALLSALSDSASTAGQLPALVTQLVTAIENEDAGTIVSTSVSLIENVARLVTSLEALGTALNAAASSLAGMTAADVEALAAELATRLAEYCLLVYLEAYWPRVASFVRATGLADYDKQPGRAGDPTNPPYTRRSLHLERLPQLLKSPPDYLVGLYGWGSPTFDGQKLLDNLRAILFRFGIPAVLEPVGTSALNQLHVVPVRLAPAPAASPPGLSLTLDLDLGSDLNLQLPFLGPTWTLSFGFQGPLGTGVGLLFTPPGNVALVPSGGAGFSVGLTNQPPDPIVLLSLDAGSRVQIDSFDAQLTVNFDTSGASPSASLDVGADLKGGKAIIDTSGSDGFLQQILSGVHVEADFEVGVDFSTQSGLHFRGAAELDIQLASHITLGPVDISAVTLSLGIKDGAFPLAISADIEAALGPLTASVEGIGFNVAFTLASDDHGNLGPLDVQPAFQPPNGAGLAIDAGIVVGGGFLYFDPDKGEYAGVAELSIADIVTVKAIGLITTKMPDGSSGFSLLLILTTDFPPIQLGFGFTLNGVGGLLGLNRSVLLDVLRDGVRTGAVNSIMFPDDPIANAPRIISDLKAVFPPQDGTFLVGPMAKAGWGTPSLITLSLGIIVEIPPGNIAILGVLAVALPEEDEALILIQVNFVGILDFDEKLLSFDASLYDSHVVFLTLAGDMAVRLKWGDNAAFLISVGGFHPSFTPPAGLNLPASMKRLTVSILDYDWAKISVDCYFAVTSNTVQFGAHLHVFFGVDGANVSGELGLDVLFQFSPFYFNALVTGSLALAVAGLDLLSINLRLSLEGPTPWHAKGTGSVSLLFFSIDVSFDVTWGDQKDTSLPPIAVTPILLAELGKQANWRALPPPYSHLFVTLASVDPSLLVLHPMGALSVSQRAVPLGLALDKVGNQAPDDVKALDIPAAASGASTLTVSEADEQFAIAQFQNLSDSQKLSSPSYQPLKGGVIVGASNAVQSSRVVTKTVAYDVIIEDHLGRNPNPLRVAAFGGAFHAFLNGNAAARSPVSFQTRSQLQPFTDRIGVSTGGYTVASTLDNTPFDATSGFASEVMAKQYLARQITANPSLSGQLHVLPDHEVNTP